MTNNLFHVNGKYLTNFLFPSFCDKKFAHENKALRLVLKTRTSSASFIMNVMTTSNINDFFVWLLQNEERFRVIFFFCLKDFIMSQRAICYAQS